MRSPTAPRGRMVALAAVSAGTVVLVCAAVVLFPLVQEWWTIRGLSSEDHEERSTAAQRLAEIGTARSIPALWEVDGQVADSPLDSLVRRLGKSAVPALQEIIVRSKGDRFRRAADRAASR